MSRERILIRYALPALIIVSLVLYLGLRNRDRLLYDLPQLAEMAVAEVDRVEIVKGDRLVAVRKQGDGWLLEPDEFPAATAQVDTMVRALASLEITDLVSEHSAYSRFELDPESALRVTAYRGDTVLRTVELGKEARTYQHTYVKVEGDSRVYQAEGDLGNYFPVVGDVLRDKLVLKVDIDTVGEIVARSPGEELVLRKRPAPGGGRRSRLGDRRRRRVELGQGGGVAAAARQSEHVPLRRRAAGARQRGTGADPEDRGGRHPHGDRVRPLRKQLPGHLIRLRLPVPAVRVDGERLPGGVHDRRSARGIAGRPCASSRSAPPASSWRRVRRRRRGCRPARRATSTGRWTAIPRQVAAPGPSGRGWRAWRRRTMAPGASA